MQLQDYKDDYYSFSSRASDISRQLSFAGIALIWIFKSDRGGPLSIPLDLLWPAFLFASALALDLLHYIIGTFIWGRFYHYHENKGMKDTEELDAPRYFIWPISSCFWGKLAAVLAGYTLILKYVYTLF